MRLVTGIDTVRGLFALVLLVGALQLIYIHTRSDLSHSAKDSWKDSSSDLMDFGRPVVHMRRVIFPRQWFKSSVNHGIRGGNKSSMQRVVIRIPKETFHIDAEHAPPLQQTTDAFLPPKYDPLMYGQERNHRGFMTIGIPSIRRPHAESIYLFQTLQSLINNTAPCDREEITVVVLLSDLNDTYNSVIAGHVYRSFQSFCDSGFIRIIKAPKHMYPNFDRLKKTFNDEMERVQWRAKQNVDFAYLCLYSRNISDYYIQLEDDVLSAMNYSNYIRIQIENTSNSWFMLEFSRLGFIGKLFKSVDIDWVANFLLTYYETRPGDLLLGKMLALSGQNTPIHADFSLFQHNGKFSSLENKMMPSIDSRFIDADKISLPIMNLPKGNNPPAKFSTNFEAVSGYIPSFAYDSNSSTYFWAKRPRRHDYFAILFESPQSFSRIIISTGDSKRKLDSLSNGMLFVGFKHKAGGVFQQNKCDNSIHISDFVDGEIDTKAMGIHIPNNLLCLKIQLKRNSKTWVIIREIVLIVRN